MKVEEYYCDRCQKQKEKDDLLTVSIGIVRPTFNNLYYLRDDMQRTLDMCPDCIGELGLIMTNHVAQEITPPTFDDTVKEFVRAEVQTILLKDKVIERIVPKDVPKEEPIEIPQPPPPDVDPETLPPTHPEFPPAEEPTIITEESK